MSLWHMFQPHDLHGSDLEDGGNSSEDEEQQPIEEQEGLGGEAYSVYDLLFDDISYGDVVHFKKILEAPFAMFQNPISIDLNHPYNFVAEAIACEQDDILRLIVEYGADVNLYNGQTHRKWIWESVVQYGLMDAIPKLMQLGCDINLCNKSGVTPLIYACAVPFQSASDSEPRFELIRMLVEQAGANINHMTKYGETALQTAIHCHFWHAAHYLAASGGVVYNTQHRKNKERALLECCGHDDVELVTALLEDGVDVNATVFEETPLMEACYQHCLPIVCKLLEFGADPTYACKNGRSPLDFGITNYKSNLVEILLPHVWKKRSMEDITKEPFLIEGDPSKYNALLTSMLYALVLTGNLEELKKLLKLYANYHNQESSSGATSVSEQNMTWLINNCVYSTFQPLYGCHLLQYAVRRNQLDVARYLLDQGADVNATDLHGNTSLMDASSSGDEDAVKLLVEHNAEINAKNNSGETALIMATNFRHRSIVQFLLEKGADVKLTTKRGQSALDFASSSKIEKLLRKKAKK